MFDDFDDQRSRKKQGRARRSLAAFLSVGVFASLALSVAGAIAAHNASPRTKPDVDVSFEELPQPKPLEVKVKPAAQPGSRRAAARKAGAAKSLASETPPEPRGAAREAAPPAPVDDFVDEGDSRRNARTAEASPPPPAAPAPQEGDNTIVQPKLVS